MKHKKTVRIGMPRVRCRQQKGISQGTEKLRGIRTIQTTIWNLEVTTMEVTFIMKAVHGKHEQSLVRCTEQVEEKFRGRRNESHGKRSSSYAERNKSQGRRSSDGWHMDRCVEFPLYPPAIFRLTAVTFCGGDSSILLRSKVAAKVHAEKSRLNLSIDTSDRLALSLDSVDFFGGEIHAVYCMRLACV